MNAEIIAVGSELLLGQIVNTNARFISRQLADMGINVFYHTVVGDNPARLEAVIKIAESRSQLIIFTGGLGPTKDDLTKETIARHLQKNLVTDEEALRSIEQYFERTNRVMTDNNRKQALILEDSQVLKNDHGMAPGMVLSTKNHTYMLLPGPPKEMEPMFLKYGNAVLLGKAASQKVIASRVLRFFGIGESLLETELEDLIEAQTNPTIAPLASDGECSIRLTASAASFDVAQLLLDEMEEKVLARAGEFFYGYDETSLMKELTKTLKDKGLTIACAESLTGGMFQQELTSYPGAGAILKGGVVCYTNTAKTDVLQVSKETIDKHGAVSRACAGELAENAANIFESDLGISFTGVAGPDESEGKPVGTVYIGISVKGTPAVVEKMQFGGGREANRIRAVKYGCHLLLKLLANSQSA
ncbi:competence/damage-inducible protein A [Bacillus canaveralius]|uniref:Putative competence-damage inducible protein n=1 Tax=Bacillus canaveralius TaxID=1403243 RepID=A0A2N5GP60_9BACI|nr:MULTISPECIES: competence/damage-inducible protein A [Bacillus]PLR84282.1 competence/damage-inducible protein A [Bacillus canaveralius]PLR86179.1 competence/damage-inducible protein A [Bacillus sp. V33-4]PLR89460.1 competence/damage-inducible protein A [Bacillus canaveralius]